MLTAAQMGQLNTVFTVDLAVGAAVVPLWLLMAWGNSRGQPAGEARSHRVLRVQHGGDDHRPVTGSPQFAPAAFTGAGAVWLIGLAAIVNLLRKQSMAYYQRQAAF